MDLQNENPFFGVKGLCLDQTSVSYPTRMVKHGVWCHRRIHNKCMNQRVIEAQSYTRANYVTFFNYTPVCRDGPNIKLLVGGAGDSGLLHDPPGFNCCFF